MKKFLLFILLALNAISAPANAQQGQALIVPSCGSQSLTAATYGYLTMDTTGKLCGSSSGGSGSVTQGTTPWIVGVTQWGGGTLGAMANYGTSPGAVLVPGMNAALTGQSGTPTQSTVNVTNSSTTVATAAAFANFLKVCVPATASTGIWVNWAGAAAVTAPPSEYMPPGQCDLWVKSTGFLPTSQVNGISNSASTIAVTVEGN